MAAYNTHSVHEKFIDFSRIPGSRWVDVKMDIIKYCVTVLSEFNWLTGSLTGSYDRGNELSSSLKSENFLAS